MPVSDELPNRSFLRPDDNIVLMSKKLSKFKKWSVKTPTRVPAAVGVLTDRTMVNANFIFRRF